MPGRPARHYVDGVTRGSAQAAASEPKISSEAAQRALARLEEMASGLRGAALIGPGGETFAASGDAERWGDAARGLLAVADEARGAPASEVHVATEDGEVFAVRHRELGAVAVAERFTLASLMASDMRAVLRDLAAERSGR
jgi:hypothetical protein